MGVQRRQRGASLCPWLQAPQCPADFITLPPEVQRGDLHPWLFFKTPVVGRRAWGGGGWKGDCQRRLKWTGQGSPVGAVTACSLLSLPSTLVSQTSLLLPVLLSLPWCWPLAALAWAVSQPLPRLQSPSCCEPGGTFQPLNLTMPLPASNSALAHTLGPSGSTSL